MAKKRAVKRKSEVSTIFKLENSGDHIAQKFSQIP